MAFTEDDFKGFWLGPDGQVWRLVGFCEQPTATFARVDDPSVRREGAVGSPILADFRRLVPENDLAGANPPEFPRRRENLLLRLRLGGWHPGE